MTIQFDSLVTLLNKSLEDVARLLDIPDDLADEAIAKYEAVAAWLGDEDSPLRQYEPELYPCLPALYLHKLSVTGPDAARLAPMVKEQGRRIPCSSPRRSGPSRFAMP